MWVDGNDPKWLEKKIQQQRLFNVTTTDDSINQCRFRDNNELLYSLRSVEKYVPWVNHIYIVTDNQTPHFVDTKKVTIIDHRDIFPDTTLLPTFNGRSIELCLARIKELSEHFLFLNDDFLFGNHVTKSDFFEKDGKPIIWGTTKKSFTQEELLSYPQKKKDVDACCAFTRTRLQKKGFNFLPLKFRHTPRPMTKTLLHELVDEFAHEFETTLQNKFRTRYDLRLSTIFPLYCIAKYESKFINLAGLSKVASTLTGKLAHVETNASSSHFKKRLFAIKYLRPKTFCINDDESTTDEGVTRTKEFLHSRFPRKSQFEI